MPLSHSLYNFARWLARDGHDAEDLVQETYLKALRNLHPLSPVLTSGRGCLEF
jgi:DNA-directed RNA polymerase specialized sigma24 family protein